MKSVASPATRLSFPPSGFGTLNNIITLNNVSSQMFHTIYWKLGGKINFSMIDGFFRTSTPIYNSNNIFLMRSTTLSLELIISSVYGVYSLVILDSHTSMLKACFMLWTIGIVLLHGIFIHDILLHVFILWYPELLWRYDLSDHYIYFAI